MAWLAPRSSAAHLVVAGRGDDHLGPVRRRELEREQGDAARAWYQHHVASLKPSLLDQREPSGQARDGQRARLRVIEVSGARTNQPSG